MTFSAVLLSSVGLLACTDKGGDGGSDHTTTPTITDADGDGYDAVEHGGQDCDDEDPAVYPGAEDAWYDGVDSDCAGDDDFDADGDGWGTDEGDCADDDRKLNPAQLDWCGDGIDQDCDGEVDGPDCGVATESAEAIWHDPAWEFLGWDLATGCDMDGDGVLEVMASAPGDDEDRVYARVVTLSEGEEFDPKDGLEVVRTSTRAGFGSAIQCRGDLDGDGYGDLVVSAFDDGPENVGRAIVVLGPMTGGTWMAEDIEDVVVEGRDPDGAFRYHVGHRVEIHDVTGDGVADIIYANGDYYSPWSIGDDGSVYESGATIILPGPFEAGDVLSTEVDDYIYLYGQQFGEFAVADLDGDGINDVLRTVGETSDDSDLCGAIYSGDDIATADPRSGLDATKGEALTALFCVADVDYHASWKVYAEDLDGDGHPDPFHATVGGWSAFQGRSDWPAEVEPDARLQQEFLNSWYLRMPGVRAADFVRDEDGELTWAFSFDGYPGQESVDADFEGRVAVFQGWEWAEQDFSESWRWVGWDADEYGIDPYYMGTRPVVFSQEFGTRLWFADPVWLTETGDETNFGRVAVFDMDAW